RLGESLPRNGAAAPRIPGPVDLAHPACAEGSEDFVWAEPGARGERHGGSRPILAPAARANGDYSRVASGCHRASGSARGPQFARTRSMCASFGTFAGVIYVQPSV